MSIHFETGALAFGADFSSLLFPYNTSNFTATIKVQGGDTFSFSATPGPGSTFFGFLEKGPFTDLTFSDGGAFGIRQGTDGLPNGTYHEELIGNPYMVVGVPEPRVISLLLLGLFAFWHPCTRKSPNHGFAGKRPIARSLAIDHVPEPVIPSASGISASRRSCASH